MAKLPAQLTGMVITAITVSGMTGDVALVMPLGIALGALATLCLAARPQPAIAQPAIAKRRPRR